MAQGTFVVSFLFGVLLVATVGAIAGHGWRRYSPAHERGEGERLSARAARVARHPTAWTLGFLVMVAAFGGGVLLVVTEGASPALQSLGVGILVGGALVVLVGYVFYGSFVSARGRGLQSSQAVAVASWAIALLFTVAVVAKLVGLF